jgi:hypothetical protein
MFVVWSRPQGHLFLAIRHRSKFVAFGERQHVLPLLPKIKAGSSFHHSYHSRFSSHNSPKDSPRGNRAAQQQASRHVSAHRIRANTPRLHQSEGRRRQAGEGSAKPIDQQLKKSQRSATIAKLRAVLTCVLLKHLRQPHADEPCRTRPERLTAYRSPQSTHQPSLSVQPSAWRGSPR